MARISEEIREHIVVQMINGKGQREVARELNISQPTVTKIWKRFLDTESTNDKAKSGRPMKSTERKKRFICRLSITKPFSGARQIYAEVGLSSTLSLSTVKRYLRKEKLMRRVSTKKPLLTAVNIKKRITWCKDSLNSRYPIGKTMFFGRSANRSTFKSPSICRKMYW